MIAIDLEIQHAAGEGERWPSLFVLAIKNIACSLSVSVDVMTAAANEESRLAGETHRGAACETLQLAPADHRANRPT